MDKQSENSIEACMENLVSVVGDKWTLLIIHALMSERLRFGELQTAVGRINPRTLSARLSRLEETGLLERHAYAEIPPRVEYSLTEKGRAMQPVLDAMRDYAVEWLPAHNPD